MPTYKLFLYFIFLFVCQNLFYGQNITSKDLDSLTKLDFEKLEDSLYKNVDIDKSIAEIFAKAYLQKAKIVQDLDNIAEGHYLMSRIYPKNLQKRIAYIDSSISFTKKTKNKKDLVFLYTHKGFVYENMGVFNRALDHYLEGLEYAKKINNLDYIAILQHNIALLKRKFKKYDEAKSLLKQCLAYEKSKIGKKINDSLSYLLTLSELVTTYRQNKEVDSALSYNNKGKTISKNTDIACLFKLNEGIIQYQNKDLLNAIDNLNTGVEKFLNSKYVAEYGNHNLINGYLFLGKSYIAVSEQDLAISNFKKIDSISKYSDYAIPETRAAYLEIISYYKFKNDKNKQLEYINRLLYNDSIFNNNYRYVNDKLVKEYDTPILIAEKEKLIADLEIKKDRSYIGLIISVLITFIITIFFILHYQKNKKYKARFHELIRDKKLEIKKEIILPLNNSIGIDKEVVDMILKYLDEFENKNGFLEINITSTILSKKMNTNSKYLTKVIKFYRNKNFTSYINDLRVDYIVEQLKINRKLQNYTIKALATEAGFNSSEVFSKSFFKKTGIYPSYFVRQFQSKKING